MRSRSVLAVALACAAPFAVAQESDLAGEWRASAAGPSPAAGEARIELRDGALELRVELGGRPSQRWSLLLHSGGAVQARARGEAGAAGALEGRGATEAAAWFDLSPDRTRLVRRDGALTLWREPPSDPARVAAALRALAPYLKHDLDPDRVEAGGRPAAERAVAEFQRRMRRLRDEWTRRTLEAARDPRKAEALARRFGPLEDALEARGLSARELFEAASAGPVALTERLEGRPERWDRAWELIERTSDRLLELERTVVANRLDLSRAARAARLDQAQARAGEALARELEAWVAAGTLLPAEREAALDAGLRRLAEVRRAELERALYPPSLTIPLGTEAWEAAMDQALGPRRTNQQVEVIVDPGEYHRALLRVLEAADARLFVSLMMFEPDRASLRLTDALSMKVRRAEELVSSLAIINRIAARALGMPWEDYARLRAVLSARAIRDLRVAQGLLAREGRELPIRDPLVHERARALADRPERERIELARGLFPTAEVKVILDGKLVDLKLLGGILGAVGIALDPAAWPAKTLLGGQGNLRIAAGAMLNDAEPGRWVREAVGHPLRQVEDTLHFLRHPIRFAYGAARDLTDVGVEVAYENRLLDGANLRELLGLNHEKVVLALTAQGTVQAVVSGNNIGAKHFPGPGGEYLWHDAGVWLEGGAGSVGEDLVRYEVRHWNDVVGPGARALAPEGWLPTATNVGDVSARIINIEPGRQRSFATAVLSGIAAADKGVEVVMPFLGSEAVLDQLGATADRWLREGWDPTLPCDPEDPAHLADPRRRRFVVILPGWLDSGFSQFGTWRAIHRLLDRGVTVLRWRPRSGQDRAHDGALYGRKAMLHAKAGRFWDARGRGFCFVGSGNFMTPVIDLGIMRDLSLYSDDPRVMADLGRKLIAPTLAQSVPARKGRWPVRMLNEVVGLITRPFQ